MTTRYQKAHYEDVADILKGQLALKFGPEADDAVRQMAHTFAGLFAMDNPPTCYGDGDHEGECYGPCLRFGFDREQFLAACGLREDVACLSCGDTGVLIRHGGREERCACGKLAD